MLIDTLCLCASWPQHPVISLPTVSTAFSFARWRRYFVENYVFLASCENARYYRLCITAGDCAFICYCNCGSSAVACGSHRNVGIFVCGRNCSRVVGSYWLFCTLNTLSVASTARRIFLFVNCMMCKEDQLAASLLGNKSNARRRCVICLLNRRCTRLSGSGPFIPQNVIFLIISVMPIF